MAKFYFVYARFPYMVKKANPASIYLRLEYDKDSDSWFGLYGWTPVKALAKRFMETRNPMMFTMRSIDIPKNSIEREKLSTMEYIRLEIIEHEFNTDGKVVLPVTVAEKTILGNKDQTTSLLIDMRGYSRRFAEFPFRFDLLSKRIRKSLDAIAFSEFLVEYQFAGASVGNLSSEEGVDMLPFIEELTEKYMHNIPYGRGLSGQELPEWDIDSLMAFVYIFGDMLKGARK